MNIKSDFHMHTTASDGIYSPRELLIKAKENNLSILAITDHDSVEGLEEAITAGSALGIRVIPGIELSTLFEDESIHVLGYFKNEEYKNEEFINFLKKMKEYRLERGEKIVNNLKEYFNIELDFNKILKEAKGIIARPHIAKAIIEAGYDYSWDYIFENIINKHSPAYVPYKKVSVEEGISLLKKFNALTVLAHPVLIKNHPLEDLLKYDFNGIEAIYPLNSEEDTKVLINLAKRHNKFITAGSDYHGLKNDTRHGKLGDLYLAEEQLDIFLYNLSNN